MALTTIWSSLWRRLTKEMRKVPSSFSILAWFAPSKGVEDLVTAFSKLDPAQAENFRLSVVGETWEDWHAPDQAIAQSPYAALIDRVDRYVTDAEVAAYFQRADAVVLPYHRSSASGPLHIAMSAGLPVIVTSVGGLVEAVEDYPGALLVPPRDPIALRDAMVQMLPKRGRRYSDPHSWQRTADGYRAIIEQLPAVKSTSAASSGFKASRLPVDSAHDTQCKETSAEISQ